MSLVTGQWWFKRALFFKKGKAIGGHLCDGSKGCDEQIGFVDPYRAAIHNILRNTLTIPGYEGITILRTFSPDHFENGQWDTGGRCVRTTPGNSPISDLTRMMVNIQLDEYRNFKGMLVFLCAYIEMPSLIGSRSLANFPLLQTCWHDTSECRIWSCCLPENFSTSSSIHLHLVPGSNEGTGLMATCQCHARWRRLSEALWETATSLPCRSNSLHIHLVWYRCLNTSSCFGRSFSVFIWILFPSLACFSYFQSFCFFVTDVDIGLHLSKPCRVFVTISQYWRSCFEMAQESMTALQHLVWSFYTSRTLHSSDQTGTQMHIDIFNHFQNSSRNLFRQIVFIGVFQAP